MKIDRVLTVLGAAIVISGAGQELRGDIVLSLSFDEASVVDTKSIAQGTPNVELFLHFSAIDGPRGNDAGASFTGFTYGVEANNSGSATPSFVKPITAANLNAALQSWTINDGSAAGAPNQVAGNVNEPTGNSRFPFGSSVLSLTLETSGLAQGDEVVVNPNLFSLAAVSSGANDFGGNGNYVFQNGTVAVTAVPEPSILLLAVMSGVVLFGRWTYRSLLSRVSPSKIP